MPAPRAKTTTVAAVVARIAIRDLFIWFSFH